MRPAPAPLRDVVRAVERRLRSAALHYGHGTHSPRDEAAYLVLRGLRLRFETPAERLLDARQVERVELLTARRIEERVPAAYLLKEAWLSGRAFHVDERVIIPRSHIAELLERKLLPWQARAPRRVLDLCTGSGCLAILAALAFPRARVDGADLSADALAVARRNVARYRLGERVRLFRSDLFRGLPGRRYDLIITNPPYVTAASMRRLPSEYRHEPALALAGGRDGLDLVRRILGEAAEHLTPRGILVCEIGAGRKALERARPDLPFVWPQTAAGTGQVFLLPASSLDRRSGAAGKERMQKQKRGRK